MKEKVFNITRYSMFAIALIQLALSQIHIGIITKVFATNVGFYLFLFIIFGIVVAFNSINLRSNKNMLLDIVGSIVAAIAGIKYLSIIMDDLNSGNVLTFSEAKWSIAFTSIAIAGYLFGTIILLLTKGEKT
ncbi:hypothetical protein [Fusibacter bizertensis]